VAAARTTSGALTPGCRACRSDAIGGHQLVPAAVTGDGVAGGEGLQDVLVEFLGRDRGERARARQVIAFLVLAWCARKSRGRLALADRNQRPRWMTLYPPRYLVVSRTDSVGWWPRMMTDLRAFAGKCRRCVRYQ
jgi:hypothetical protein